MGSFNFGATCDLRAAMIKLWGDHGFYTREVVLAALQATDNLGPALNRLLRNQEDIGGAIGSIYGDDAGKQCTALLKDHINIAVEVVQGAAAGDQAKFEDADKRWYDNASDIAKFLSAANPNWPYDAAYDMMKQHLDLLTEVVKALIAKDYEKGITTNDTYMDEIYMMADMFAAGIAEQFSDKFSRAAA